MHSSHSHACVWPEKCPSGWHHYEKTASCYKVYLHSENYWQAADTCQKVDGSLATFVTDEELQFILKIEVDFDDEVCKLRDQCKWVAAEKKKNVVIVIRPVATISYRPVNKMGHDISCPDSINASLVPRIINIFSTHFDPPPPGHVKSPTKLPVFVLQVLGGLPVCDHQPEPLCGGPLGGGL